jgi:hypothetical protein
MAVSVVEQLRRRVWGGGRRHWTIGELRESINASGPAVWQAVRAMVADGILERERRGMYWHPGHPEDARRTVQRRRTPGQAARSLLQGRATFGPTEWGAANALGLSTQLSPVEVLAVTGARPRAPHGAAFRDRTSRTQRRQARLNELEVALLEVLEGWHRYVELPGPEAAERLLEVLKGDRVREDALVRAARTEPALVRERLKRLFVMSGSHELAGEIAPAVDYRTRNRALRVFGPDEGGRA